MKTEKRSLFKVLHPHGVNDVSEHLSELYSDGMSMGEIVEHLNKRYGYECSERGISYHLKKAGVTIRSKSEGKKLAMQRGRMIYHKKPVRESYKVKYISKRVRYEVLKRDGHRCMSCGLTVHDGARLELHHVDGDESVPNNLRTLCVDCHQGLHSQ